MNKIQIIGIGPGHSDYILPIATRKINEMDIIISGKRNLEFLDIKNKEIYLITADLNSLTKFINENIFKKIGIIVSGDPAFYSMLKFIKRNFKENEYEIIAGISSLTYFFNKIKRSYEKSYFISIHGRDEEFIDKIESHRYVGLLTDNINSPKYIAEELIINNMNYKMYIGENLSYSNEKIYSGYPEDIVKISSFEMSVVVIENENYKR